MLKHSADENDIDPGETHEWLDALEAVVQNHGMERAHYLLKKLSDHATRSGAQIPYALTTPFRNTIPTQDEAPLPGDMFTERRLRSLIRWKCLDHGDAGQYERRRAGRPYLQFPVQRHPVRCWL